MYWVFVYVDFDIEKGEIVLFVGFNGFGKMMLLRLFFGLLWLSFGMF